MYSIWRSPLTTNRIKLHIFFLAFFGKLKPGMTEVDVTVDQVLGQHLYLKVHHAETRVYRDQNLEIPYITEGGLTVQFGHVSVLHLDHLDPESTETRNTGAVLWELLLDPSPPASLPIPSTTGTPQQTRWAGMLAGITYWRYVVELTSRMQSRTQRIWPIIW